VATRFEILRDEALGCTKCKLATLGRTQVVFGTGDPAADLLFVGEGPGAEEDRQGLPFVGRSGQLLDKLMLEEIGITRDQCYIANVVKCRPPGNRDPEPDEIETCRPYLDEQVELIDPKVVVTLGKFSSQLLLASKVGITKLRGQSYPYRGGVLIPTLHPAYALRGGGAPMAQMRADFVRAKVALAEAERASTGGSAG
jgi:DNA polymerase